MDPAFGVSSSCNDPAGGETILIVGASARAAAMSARRGGLNPWAADMFGDLDLGACCPVERIDDYPHGLERALAGAPAGPWMYTGALENHPDLVDRIAAVRPLYGVGGQSLRAVRDPQRLAAAVQAAGFAAPRCSLSPANVPTDGSWLSKRRASAGGNHIVPWHGQVGHAVRADTTTGRTARSSRYFQEQIEGLPASAIYIGTREGAICLGVTRQLLGLSWCGAERATDRFRYCGSIGPLDMSIQLAEQFQDLGSAIARSFALIGLFGVDAAIDRGDKIWTIEVNPRYTASIEILERASAVNAVHLHVQAFSASSASSAFQTLKRRERGGRRAAGKAVLYAPASLAVGVAFLGWAESQNRGRAWPAVADIPSLGTEIQAGQPIVTLFADDTDEPSVLNGLKALAAEAYRNLAVSPPYANNSRAEMS
jgi:uncharacterized protein